MSNPIDDIVDIITKPIDWIGDVIDGVVDIVGDVVSWFIDIPDIPDIDAQARGALVNKESNIAALPVVYGTRRMGGTRVFVETSGTDNKYLYMVIALCEGEVQSVTNVNINDVPLIGSKYEPYVLWQYERGTDTQTANPVMLNAPSWESTDRLLGVAVLYVRLEFNADVFTSIPNITALVTGKKVYDPRTDTTGHSSNPALCLRDYLTNTRYGKGLDPSLIDDTSFGDAANKCDGEETPYVGFPEDIKRFSINAIINTDQSIFDNVSLILRSMQGMMPYQNGQYRLIVEDDYASSFAFTTDNMIGGIQFSGASKKKRYNKVIAKFVNPDANWQADSVTWPESDSTDYSTFLTEDNNVVLEAQLDLSTVTNFYQARNIAKTLCLASRKNAISLSIQATSEALEVAVGDIVTVTHPTPAWEAKEFRVTRMSINNDGTVNLSMIEHNATVYPWIDDKEEPESLESNLPDPLTIASPSLTITDQLRSFNQEAITFLVADVGTGDSFVERFEVQALKAGDTQYVNMGEAGGTRFELSNVEDGATYTVRARAINSLGVRSAFTSESHQVVGKTAPPSDVTGLTGNLIGNQYLLVWDAVPDLDLSHYRIRFASADGAQTYQNSISLVPKVARPATSVLVPARNGTYFCKAIDKLGLASENPATIVLDSNIDDLEDLQTVFTYNEHPDFVGTFDDVIELDDEDLLILNTSLDFDAVAGDFDDAAGLFDGGSGNVDASGFYYFDEFIDFGAVYMVRGVSRIVTSRRDYVNQFDFAEGLFDDRSGFFEGDVNAFDDTDVELQVRITEDDPAGTPTWSEWSRFDVRDMKARGLEFRAKLSTTDNQATPVVSELGVTLFMSFYTISGDDLTSGTSSYGVTFGKPFKDVPSIGIGAQNMQTGDYYVLSGKSRTGFTITFYDSTDTIVSRTFDYVAKGYGREVS